MAEKKHVALLRGGKSKEREVSLASGREVMKALNRDRFIVSEYDPATDLGRLLNDAPDIDVAFLALHGPFGEDGTIQGFCEMLGLKYTGSGVLASAMAMDKDATKKMYRHAGLPVAKDLVYTDKDGLNSLEMSRRAMEMLGSKVVVKPLCQGSSLGLSIVSGLEDLNKALSDVLASEGLVLLEQYIDGREFTCGVLGNDTLTALPLIEIIPAPGHAFFDFSAKYEPGQAEEKCPAHLTPQLTAEISRLAIAAHQVLGCRGLSRTDFMMRDNQPYLLETNTLPGLTSGSLLPKMAKTYGLSFTNFLSYVVDLALEGPEPQIDDYR